MFRLNKIDGSVFLFNHWKKRMHDICVYYKIHRPFLLLLLFFFDAYNLTFMTSKQNNN